MDSDLEADLAFLDAAAKEILAKSSEENGKEAAEASKNQEGTEKVNELSTVVANTPGDNSSEREQSGVNKKRKVELEEEEVVAAPTLNASYMQQLVTGTVYDTGSDTKEAPVQKRTRLQGNTPSILEIGMSHGINMEHAQLIEQQQRAYGYTGAKKESLSESATGEKKKKIVRSAGGEKWEDPTLADWPDNDYRIFVGDLGNEVTNEILLDAFRDYPSATKARVILNKKSRKVKGYGFVSFMDPLEMGRALREKQGKYCGNRPMKLRKSNWQERNLANAIKRDRDWKKKHGIR